MDEKTAKRLIAQMEMLQIRMEVLLKDMEQCRRLRESEQDGT